MSVLIVYASKYGSAQKCAESLAEKLKGNVDLVDIQKENVPALSNYHQVIVGGSIRFGRIQKQITEFLSQNIQALKTKKLGLFICCGFADNAPQHMQNVFPKDLLEAATVKECFGGEMDIHRLKFMDKLVAKMVTKMSEKEGKKPPILLTDRIDPFAKAMNAE